MTGAVLMGPRVLLVRFQRLPARRDRTRPGAPGQSYAPAGRNTGRRSGSQPWFTFFAMALYLFCVSTARAHHVEMTRVDMLFRADGTYQIDVGYDANLLVIDAAGPVLTDEEKVRLVALPTAELSAILDELRATFDRRITLRFDDEIHEAAIDFRADDPRGRTIRLTGSVPVGAQHLVFWASRVFGTVPLTVRYEGHEMESREVLEVAARSAPIAVRLEGAAAAAASPARSAAQAALRYAQLGFEHIIPKGLDHILFVVGLYLLSTRLSALLWQVTAFTIAHTLTLALSMYGVVSLSPRIVEPLIALSIAYVAVENIFTTKLKPWRPAVVFVFGLLHGLGFAGVLTELGLPRGQFVTALAAFNVGVELGQLAVITSAFLVTGWFRHRSWYRAGLVVPASLLIAVVALYWTVQRAVGG